MGRNRFDSTKKPTMKTLLTAASLLVTSFTLHAENATPAPAISQERMQAKSNKDRELVEALIKILGASEAPAEAKKG